MPEPEKRTWKDAIGAEKQQSYFREILRRVAAERARHTVFPPADEVFEAFRRTEFAAVKAVILGQDPYHNPGEAHGLAFSVRESRDIPPSLLNIYKELSEDIPNFVIPEHGNLTLWAERGVLLLNNVLTVRAHAANSHRDLGWETFTDRVIDVLNRERDGLVFMLWGAAAKQKGARIDRNRHLVLTAPHPSPLSAYRGFFGCRHFSRCNEYLVARGIAPIDWNLEPERSNGKA